MKKKNIVQITISEELLQMLKPVGISAKDFLVLRILGGEAEMVHILQSRQAEEPDECIIAKTIFPERAFSKKEKTNLSFAVDVLQHARTSPVYKNGCRKIKANFPSMMRIAEKVIHAENIILMSNRRPLTIGEKKIFNRLLSDKDCARLVVRNQIMNLWEDVKEKRKPLKAEMPPVHKMSIMLRDPEKKRLFISEIIFELFLAQRTQKMRKAI